MPRKDSQSSSDDQSGDSSDGSSDQEWVLYSHRKEWSDVTPIPLKDENCVATIKYSEKFSDTYNYFRAILHLNEKSERAFHLTTDCIKLNASNSTVWYFRRVLLKELNKDLQAEINFLNRAIIRNPKNYQVWHHRQWLLESINSLEGEKEFIGQILDSDGKNYHCWQHRQWLVQHFSAWDGELEYTEQLISLDIRNNAAWHHRYFVVSSTDGFTDDVIGRETAFTLDKIKLAPNNESSWNYLRGILKGLPLASFPPILEFVQGFIDKLDSSTTKYAIAFKVDVLSEQIEEQTDSEKKNILIEEAVRLCDQLATENDSIRCTYWKYIGQSLRAK